MSMASPEAGRSSDGLTQESFLCFKERYVWHLLYLVRHESGVPVIGCEPESFHFNAWAR